VKTENLYFTPTVRNDTSVSLGTAALTGTNLCADLPGTVALHGQGLKGDIAVTRLINNSTVPLTGLTFESDCGTQSAPMTFTISNPGNATMTWTGSVKALNDGDDATAFSLSPDTSEVAAGDSVTVTVSMTRVQGATTALVNAELVIKTDIPGDPVHSYPLLANPLGDSLSISGAALSAVCNQGGCQNGINHWAIDFGSVSVLSNPDPKNKTFLITNSANVDTPDAVLTVDVTGDHYTITKIDDVSKAPGTQSVSGVHVPAGTSVTVQVTFTVLSNSNDMGDHTGSIAISRNEGNSPNGTCTSSATGPSVIPGPNVDLLGTATLGEVTVTPTALDFNQVDCGTSLSLANTQVTIGNDGNDSLVINGLAVDKPLYYSLIAQLNGVDPVSDISAITLAKCVSQPCPFVVVTVTGTVPEVWDQFAPTPSQANPADPFPGTKVGGLFAGKLTFTTNGALDNGQTHTVTLAMQAHGAIIDPTVPLLSTVWNFQAVQMPNSSYQSFGIRNIGNDDALVSLIDVSLNQSGQTSQVFALDSTPTTVAPSSITTVRGVFTPDVPDGYWIAQGTLKVAPVAQGVLCKPLPDSWNSKTISLYGSSLADPI
jgi:hypothetical protein